MILKPYRIKYVSEKKLLLTKNRTFAANTGTSRKSEDRDVKPITCRWWGFMEAKEGKRIRKYLLLNMRVYSRGYGRPTTCSSF